MAWVKFATRKSIVIRASLEEVRKFLLRIVECGRLMPSIVRLEEVGPNIYRYQLAEVSNGAIQFTPDYMIHVDTSDPNQIRWQPYGEHNFRSWGAFLIEPDPTREEVVLEIDTRAEASVSIDPILVPVVQPFAKMSSDRVTEEFLQRIRTEIEAGRALLARETRQPTTGTVPLGMS